MLLNLILDTLAERFTRLAVTEEWGLLLRDGTWVNLILLAGNYWLAATSARMLQDMTRAWLQLLSEYGWETPTPELTWCATQADEYTAKIDM